MSENSNRTYFCNLVLTYFYPATSWEYTQKILPAINLMEQLESGKVRRSGGPTKSHLYGTAIMTMENMLLSPERYIHDPRRRKPWELITSAILHDAKEDHWSKGINIVFLTKNFSEAVADSNSRLSKPCKEDFLHIFDQALRKATIRKLYYEVINELTIGDATIKLADNLFNLRTMGFDEIGRLTWKVWEHNTVYSPIARRHNVLRKQLRAATNSLASRIAA